MYELPRPGVKAVLEVPEGTPRGIGVGLSDNAMEGLEVGVFSWDFCGPRVR